MKAPNLQSIDFNGIDCSDLTLLAPRLQKIVMRDRSADDKFITALNISCPNLISLVCSNAEINTVVFQFPKLELLDLSIAKPVSHLTIHCPNLSTLCLNHIGTSYYTNLTVER